LVDDEELAPGSTESSSVGVDFENNGYEIHDAEIVGGHEPLSWRGGLA